MAITLRTCTIHMMELTDIQTPANRVLRFSRTLVERDFFKTRHRPSKSRTNNRIYRHPLLPSRFRCSRREPEIRSPQLRPVRPPCPAPVRCSSRGRCRPFPLLLCDSNIRLFSCAAHLRAPAAGAREAAARCGDAARDGSAPSDLPGGSRRNPRRGGCAVPVCQLVRRYGTLCGAALRVAV